jgi:hypothetical protein
MDDITISIPADFISDFLTIVRTAGEQQLTTKQRALTADLVGQVADGVQQFLSELSEVEAGTAVVVSEPAKKTRRISAAGRKAIAAAQRKRWAEKKKGK